MDIKDVVERMKAIEVSLDSLTKVVNISLLDTVKTTTKLEVDVDRAKLDISKNCTAIRTHVDKCNERYSKCQDRMMKEDKLDKRAIIGWAILIVMSLSSMILTLIGS